MGRDIVEGAIHLGLGTSTSGGTNGMPDDDDNDSNLSFNLSVEDSGFQTEGMGTKMGRAISNQERVGAYQGMGSRIPSKGFPSTGSMIWPGPPPFCCVVSKEICLQRREKKQ